MRRFTILVLLFLLSCAKGKKDNIELKIETKELKIGSNLNGINIITYSITNNSEDIYYINNQPGNIKLPFSISKERKFLRIYSESQECKYYPIFVKESEKILDCYLLQQQKKEMDSKNLNYKNITMYDLFDLDKINFFIYPNQTLYFEYYVSIDKYNGESKQSSNVSIDYKTKQNYYATLSIASDSTNYKNDLPRDILKTIEANHVKVYHGIVESSNKVPIKIIE